MISTLAINEIRTDKKNLMDFFPFIFNRFKNKPHWSHKTAELSSLTEVINQSALVSVSDLQGNIIHANELFCRVSKYTIEELLNKPHSIFRHPDTPPSLFKEMWNTISNGKVWQGELKNRSKDGADFWVMATMAPIIGMNGKPVRYICVRFDITKQIQTEQELKQVKKRIDGELYENIDYAKHIHSAFLTNNEGEDLSKDSFLIYKPQKIISGDFYKIERKGDKILVVVGDSTGHGFSASYISILALNILTRIMIFSFENPAGTLKTINNELHKVTRFNKEKKLTESTDMIICCVDKQLMKLTYASAGMKAFIIRGEEIILLEKDKSTIGEVDNTDLKIENRSLDLKKGDCFYILSDGLIHQIGGNRGKCIGLNRIQSVLQKSQHCSMPEQKKIIEDTLLEWQRDNEQTDDITMFGIKI